MRILDTSVAIDHLRGFQPAVSLLKRLIAEAQPVLGNEVVRFELLAGARDDELEALEQFCSAIVWIPVSEGIARTAGELARQHRGAFSGIDAADYLIAATALVLDARLLTTNVRHFPMLAGLRPAY
ncbi:MAG: type II toxin-antitoxin system VapC family toxin [Candidatus Dormibacter sp.]|uniref:type II toxin-antitoxin system VapC family toxin n=1 Tax=Candidatus Dormibacter sp. TaxID=2973982 RepID=UPI000DB8A80E|nr:MAG: VapC toxin family PIN domain ribonuclease [Candidatus Dormibacteraeota bacterium]